MEIQETELNDHDTNSSSSEESNGTHSESDISDKGQDELEDSDYQPELENTESFGDSEVEPGVDQGHEGSSAASKQNQKKQLQRDPIPGDSCYQHATSIKRLIRQVESSGKSCYLGPPVGWDMENFTQFFKSIDEEIPDAANIQTKGK